MNIDEVKAISIIVKNIPNEFSNDDCKELFSMYNFKSFNYLINKRSNGNTATVTFKCLDDAFVAVFNLHERKVLNKYLNAKIVRNESTLNNCKEPSSVPNDDSMDTKKQENVNIIPEWIKDLLSLAPTLNFKEPIKPKLKYKYPKPNNIILTNIVRALMCNEKFYTQTLHLMNKFHFPIPFSCDITFPGKIIVINSDEINEKGDTSIEIKNVEISEMEISSGNESEISDGYHSPQIKRRKLSLNKIRRIPHTTNYSLKSTQRTTYAIDELFDTDKNKSENQIKLNVVSSLNDTIERTKHAESHFIEEEGFGKIVDIPQSNVSELVSDIVLENINENFQLTKDKTNTIFDNCNDRSKPNSVLIDKPEKILSIDDIKNNTLSSTSWTNISAFKNYNPGQQSCRLYIKNLARKVTKDDLISLYSGFLDWSDEDEIKLFSITLFTEGKMKGQAFINLPSVSVSERALKLTNAFVLYDKPLVVQFAKTSN